MIGQPELIILPLRLPVQVFSGVAPPRALLDALAAQRPVPVPGSSDGMAPPGVQPQQPPLAQSSPAYAANPPAAGQPPDDAPPSYEDAMAQDLGPVDGLRRDYADMPTELDGRPGRSSTSLEKTPGGDNDRLFPRSGPGQAPR